MQLSPIGYSKEKRLQTLYLNITHKYYLSIKLYREDTSLVHAVFNLLITKFRYKGSIYSNKKSFWPKYLALQFGKNKFLEMQLLAILHD